MKSPKETNIFPMEQMEKSVKPNIKSNSDGGFPVGFNPTEARLK